MLEEMSFFPLETKTNQTIKTPSLAVKKPSTDIFSGEAQRTLLSLGTMKPVWLGCPLAGQGQHCAEFQDSNMGILWQVRFHIQHSAFGTTASCPSSICKVIESKNHRGVEGTSRDYRVQPLCSINLLIVSCTGKHPGRLVGHSQLGRLNDSPWVGSVWMPWNRAWMALSLALLPAWLYVISSPEALGQWCWKEIGYRSCGCEISSEEALETDADGIFENFFPVLL